MDKQAIKANDSFSQKPKRELSLNRRSHAILSSYTRGKAELSSETVCQRDSPSTQTHCFCSCRTLIEKRGIGNLHASHVTYQRLVVEQGLQATLGYLWLIWCVLCCPMEKEKGSPIYRYKNWQQL